jgi:nitroimidazol reductase NimA-like FMN-containing flavoprotein (pyridoxamine 5'-phosphate oxidase superfamily)
VSTGVSQSTVTWNDRIDAIFAGDLVAGLGYRTPAGGVVVQAVAPIGLRDRGQQTVGFTTSLGFSKKLERIAADPRVALAFHSRRHGSAVTREYVLAQGRARVIAEPSEAERKLVRSNATAHLGAAKSGPFWDRWLREYYQVRVPVLIELERLVIWPNLDAQGTPEVSGQSLPKLAPEPQRPPRQGVGARLDAARAAHRLRGTEYTLLGFTGADGRPCIVPVTVGAPGRSGIPLTTAAALPPGGRRAGLLGHSFRPQLVGLEARQHTGWLSVQDGVAHYAPHTEVGYKAPANKTLLLLLNGALAKKGVRNARRSA